MRILALTFAGLSMSVSALAVEKYSATVNDGTAEVIRPNRVVTPEPAEEFLEQVAPAPKKKRTVATKQATAPNMSEGNADSFEHRRQRRQTAEERFQELEEAQVERGAVEAAPHAAPVLGALPDDLPALYPADGIELTSDEASVPAPEEERLAEKKAVKVEMAKKPVTGTFDVVPDKRIPELAQRLKYTNEILKRWGRAYDYRTTTTRQLRQIVAELEAVDENSQPISN